MSRKEGYRGGFRLEGAQDGYLRFGSGLTECLVSEAVYSAEAAA